MRETRKTLFGLPLWLVALVLAAGFVSAGTIVLVQLTQTQTVVAPTVTLTFDLDPDTTTATVGLIFQTTAEAAGLVVGQPFHLHLTATCPAGASLRIFGNFPGNGPEACGNALESLTIIANSLGEANWNIQLIYDTPGSYTLDWLLTPLV